MLSNLKTKHLNALLFAHRKLKNTYNKSSNSGNVTLKYINKKAERNE